MTSNKIIPNEGNKKSSWIIRITALSFTIALVLTPTLWSSLRAYPTIPITDSLPLLPNIIENILYYGLVTLCITLILMQSSFTKTRKIIASSIIVLYLSSAFFDQQRLVPFFIHFVVLIAICAFSSPKKAPALLATVFIGTYFWSGAQKINYNYVTQTFPILIEPFVSTFSLEAKIAISYIGGILSGPIETALALALLFPKLRTIAVIGLAGMHISILLCVGPLVHNHNSQIWFWNIASIALLFIIFFRSTFTAKEILKPTSLGQLILLVFFLFMPSLNFAQKWDDYLSMTLYSGNEMLASIELQEEDLKKLPNVVQDVAQKKMSKNQSAAYKIETANWALKELNAPDYHAMRVHKKVLERVCDYTESSTSVRMIIRHRPNWKNGNRELEILNCLYP